MPGHAGDIGVVPSAQLPSPQQDYLPARLQEPPFCCMTPSGQAGDAQGPLSHTPSTASPCCPQAQRDGGGSQGRGADGKQKPLKSSSPRGYFLSLPKDHKCFSKTTLLQCVGRQQCPPLPRAGLPVNRDGMADTMERPGGQWGTLPGSSSPQPLHQQALQTPPRMPIFVAICAPDGASPQPLNTSPRSSTRHPAQKHKKSQPWQTWTSPNGQRSAQALPVAKALTALSERLSGTVLAPQRLPVMSTSNCFWLTTRPP